MVRVGINGFGRIGRQVAKAMVERYGDDIQLVAINDLSPVETNAHMFKYDSNYGIFDGDVTTEGDSLVINGNKVANFRFRDPAEIPWDEVGADIVVESTGLFLTKETASAHLKGGAKKVIISAPSKGEDITIVMGVNHEQYDPAQHTIVSNASCTTNCLAPAAKVVNEAFGIKKALMTTVHAYTGDQRIQDTPHSDPRRARAAALSIIPTSTGAAKAVSLVVPELAGKFDGYALRVPTPTVSIVDFVAELEKETTTEELRAVLKEAANGPLKGIMAFEEQKLVSVDFKGNPHSSIIDAEFTQVMQGNMIKVVTWYDNEWGYSNRVADLAKYMADKGL